MLGTALTCLLSRWDPTELHRQSVESLRRVEKIVIWQTHAERSVLIDT